MVKAHILRVLCGVPPAGIVVAYLRTEISVRMGRRIGDGEFAEAVTALKEQGLASEDTDEFTTDPRLAITPKGRKAAARL